MTIEVGDKVILIPDERGGYITQKIGTIAAGDKVILFSDGRGGHIAVKSGTIGVGDKVKAISYMGKRYIIRGVGVPPETIYCSHEDTGDIYKINLTDYSAALYSSTAQTVFGVPYFIRTGKNSAIIRVSAAGAGRTYWYSHNQCLNWAATTPYNAGYRSGCAATNTTGKVMKIEYLDDDWYNSKIALSTNYGRTWTSNTPTCPNPLGGGSRIYFLGRSDWLIHTTTPEDSNSLYVSHNDGTTWESCTVPVGATNVITGAGNNKGIYYALGIMIDDRANALFKSTDFGKTWEYIGEYTGAPSKELAIINDIFYSITSSELYRSVDGITWTHETNGAGGSGDASVNISNVHKISNNRILTTGGASGGNGWNVSTDNGITWTVLTQPVDTYQSISFPDVYNSANDYA